MQTTKKPTQKALPALLNPLIADILILYTDGIPETVSLNGEEILEKLVLKIIKSSY